MLTEGRNIPERQPNSLVRLSLRLRSADRGTVKLIRFSLRLHSVENITCT